jgi:HK97 gp10 family phage protein
MAKSGTPVREQVVGVNELRRKLERAGDDASKAVAEGLQLGAQVIVGAAKQIIREKDIIDTGNLLNSVQSWPPEYTTGGQGGKTQVSVDIGTPVEYGVYQEFGTSRMGARPWLRPAFDENVGKARAAVAYSLQKRLEQLRATKGGAE